MRTWWRDLREQLRSSFWFVPVSMCVTAALLALFTLAIDARVGETELALSAVTGVRGAENLLTTAAASMVTVGATVVSLTIVAMQLASTQFGPRLLTNFVRDRLVQAAMGTFLAVFVNAVMVLRTVDTLETLPRISILVTQLLTAAAVVMLIVFVHHIASTIQAMNLVGTISRDIGRNLDSLFPDPERYESVSASEVEPDLRGDGTPVHASSTGYLQLVDLDRLIALAREHDVVLRLGVRPGLFMVDHTPVASAWRRDGSDAADLDDDVLASFSGCFVTGHRRTHDQDAEFPVRQLVEVAVRSLSPGINDPVTAGACADHLSAVLCRVARRRMPPRVLADGDGTPRVVNGDPLTFSGLVAVSFDQIRQSADHHAVVYTRLLEALTRLLPCCEEGEQRRAVLRQADLVLERAEEAVRQEADLEPLRELHRQLQPA